MSGFNTASKLALISLVISACQLPNVNSLAKKPIEFMQIKTLKQMDENSLRQSIDSTASSFNDLVESPNPEIDIKSGFRTALRLAIQNDPEVVQALENLESLKASYQILTAGKDFQVSGVVYAGVEDVTDETSGVAVVLGANRLLYDGGSLNGSIVAQRFRIEAARHGVEVLVNERAKKLASIWVELSRYETLFNKIEERLMILEPLLRQLEKVAEAGIGDVTRVAAAQRTVAAIEVTKADVELKLEQARIEFVNEFGSLPDAVFLDFNFITVAVPTKIDKKEIEKIPTAKVEYASYKAAEADLFTIRAKDSVNIGFEAKVQRPFASSEYDSDEQIGVVLKKTIYDGKKLDSEIAQAEANVRKSTKALQTVYRDSKRILKASRHNIDSMNKAILLAKKHAAEMVEEITYLKKQLIIGGSTLDNVLSAEARLYDTESKEIDFLAEKRLSELTLLSTTGLMQEVLDISFDQ